MTKKKHDLKWRVHTANLLSDIVMNISSQTSTIRIPIAIFGRLIHQVAKRASQLNDPILNDLMCRMALYDDCDPTSKGYNQATVDRILINFDEEEEDGRDDKGNLASK